jgi:hypothetical protein
MLLLWDGSRREKTKPTDNVRKQQQKHLQQRNDGSWKAQVQDKPYNPLGLRWSFLIVDVNKGDAVDGGRISCTLEKLAVFSLITLGRPQRAYQW